MLYTVYYHPRHFNFLEDLSGNGYRLYSLYTLLTLSPARSLMCLEGLPGLRFYHQVKHFELDKLW